MRIYKGEYGGYRYEVEIVKIVPYLRIVWRLGDTYVAKATRFERVLLKGQPETLGKPECLKAYGANEDEACNSVEVAVRAWVAETHQRTRGVGDVGCDPRRQRPSASWPAGSVEGPS